MLAYTKKTKKDIFSHPLASRLRGCDSPAAIIAVLQEGQLDGSWGGEEILAKFLNPTVNVICAYSQVLGGGIGSVNIPLMCREFWSDTYGQVFSPADAVFTGIGILLAASDLIFSFPGF